MLPARASCLIALAAVLQGCPVAPPTTPSRATKTPSTPPASSPAPAAAVPSGPIELRGGSAALPWHVVIEAEDPATRARALTLAPMFQAVVSEVVRQLDPTVSHGEFWTFNRTASRKPLPIAGPTLEIVDACLALGQRTGGAFDITAGPLRSIWQDPSSPPDAVTVETARARVGLQRVRAVKGMLKKDVTDLELDAAAVIDGVAANVLARTLRERAFSAFRVEVGGAAVVEGTGPWSIALPAGGNGPVTVNGIKTAAVAVAVAPADAVLIDPRAGRPVGHDVVSCIVVADSALEADALAEACLVLGPGIVKVLQGFKGVEAQWRRRNGATEASPGFPG